MDEIGRSRARYGADFLRGTVQPASICIEGDRNTIPANPEQPWPLPIAPQKTGLFALPCIELHQKPVAEAGLEPARAMKPTGF
jgi:hypothetical protein